ncbi:MAG: hypothetical protein WBB18_00175 [Nodosilinea sp.]
MVKRHTHFQLALVSLGLLCCGAVPSYAQPDLIRDEAAEPSAQPETAAGGGQAAVLTVQPVVEGAIASFTTDQPAPVAPANASVADSGASGSTPLATPYLTTAAALAAPPPESPLLDPALTTADLAQADDDSDDAPDPPQDPELGEIQIRGLLEDNDLGILRIREQPQLPAQIARPPAKIGFLSARLAIASSDNVLLAVNDVGGLTGDTFLRPSIGFGLYPALGPQTAFIATADLGLQRYSAQSSLNYDDLRLRLGLRQGLGARSYGQFVFTYQELYRPGGNRGRFFKNTALGLTLGRRDPLASKLYLDSYYLVQLNNAESTSSGTAIDFSRVFQSTGAYLGYDVTPRVQLGLNYQLNLIDYTAQERYDTFQQVLGQVVYRISPNLRLNVYGGFSFGRSSEPRVQFNDTFFGATIDATVPLF